MQDMVIKGTGNSRFLKSVENFKELYPDYNSFVEALVAGTLPVDFNGLNPAGITQMGTPYAKSEVLADETAALFGLDGTAVPDDVLRAIINGFTMLGPLVFDQNNSVTSVMSELASATILAYAKGKYTEHRRQLSLHHSNDLQSALMLDDITADKSESYSLIHTGNLEALGVTRVEAGSYMGTGTPGSAASPISLAFSFKPKLVLIVEDAMYTSTGAPYVGTSGLFFVDVLTSAYKRGCVSDFFKGTGPNAYAYAKVNETELSWYGAYDNGDAYSAGGVLNYSGYTYKYIAIG